MMVALPPIIWFTAKLAYHKGPKTALLPHLFLCFAYEIAQRLFPKNIGILYRDHAAVQGGFTNATSRIRTHAESIAALGGDRVEKEILTGLFSKVSGASHELHRGLSKFGLVYKLAYTYGCRAMLQTFVMYPLAASPATGPAAFGIEMAEIRVTSQVKMFALFQVYLSHMSCISALLTCLASQHFSHLSHLPPSLTLSPL
jgi:ABC-type uncharacterized transport system fused permease/ATPase subunit